MTVAELITQAKDVARHLGRGDDLIDIDDKFSAGMDRDLLKVVLSVLGVIQTVQGTNRIYRLIPHPGAAQSAIDPMGQLLTDIPRALKKADGRMTKKQVIELI